MRTTLTRAGMQGTLGFSRATLREADDDHNWQEAKSVDVTNSETHTNVERCQSFGFTATPLKQSEQQQDSGMGQGGDGGGLGGGGGDGGGFGDASSGGEQGKQPQGESAECMIAYLNGSRSHPVIIGIDDRRHRPYKIPPGGSFQYDQNHQGNYIHPDKGVFVLALDDEEQQQGGGSAGASALATGGGAGGGGQKKERFASLRHVDKKKQQRKGKGSGAGGSGGGGAGAGGASATALATGGGGGAGGGGGGQQEHKHEGDKVNTEVRVTKKKIEFYADDKVVGYYDKEKKEWMFKGKIRLGDENASKYVVGQVDNLTDVSDKQVYVHTQTPHQGPGIHTPPPSTELEELMTRVAALEAQLAQLQQGS